MRLNLNAAAVWMYIDCALYGNIYWRLHVITVKSIARENRQQNLVLDARYVGVVSAFTVDKSHFVKARNP